MKKLKTAKVFSQALQEAIKPICRTHNFYQQNIITDWQKIVGSYLAKISMPIALNFRYQNNIEGTLVCGLANPSYTLSLQMQSKLIMDKVNIYFGYPAVKNIKFRLVHSMNQTQNPIIIPVQEKEELDSNMKKTIHNNINKITDPKMREVLLTMGDVFFSNFGS